MSDISEERRKYQRVSLALPFSYNDTSYVYDQTTDSYTKNIGLGGIKFAVTNHIPKNTDIHVKLIINGKEPPIEITSKIVWIVKGLYNGVYHVGLEFTNIKEMDLVRITNLIYNNIY